MADQQRPVKRRVALKLIRPGMDSKLILARFEAERQALAMMDHPNIAKVLDAGATDHGRPYFVMELIKGVPITTFCDERRLTPQARVELFESVCLAVQHAHQKGIIHRDLKPSNVLVCLYDDKPVAKVIDFGVAKACGATLTDRTLFTRFEQFVGTLEYASPEQARFNQLDVDTRSDIYSLGAILYELLTGSTPLPTEQVRTAALDEVLRLIREEEAPKPSVRIGTTEEIATIADHRGVEPKALGSLVRGDLDWIVLKCLDKDRARRYETANELAADLRRFRADEPVTAGPPSAGYRLRKFVRRHRKAAIAALVVACLSLAAVLGTGLGLVRAALASHRETQALAKAELAEERERLQKADRRRQEVRSQIETGLKLADDGDLYGALGWMAAPILSAEPGEDTSSHLDRLRYYWQFSPKLTLVACYIPQVPGEPSPSVGDHSHRRFIAMSETQLHVFATRTGRQIGKPIPRSTKYPPILSENGRYLMMTNGHDRIEVWDVASGCQIVDIPNPGNRLHGLCVSDRGNLLTVHKDHKLYQWDLVTNRMVKEVDCGQIESDPVVSSNGAIAVTWNDRFLRIWDLERGTCIGNVTAEGHVVGATFGDSDRIATIQGSAWIGVLDCVAKQIVGSPIRLPRGVNFGVLSPDLSILAVASGGAVSVWSPSLGRRIGPLIGHQSDPDVTNIRFSPDGSRLVVTADTTSSLWDCREWKCLCASIPASKCEFIDDGKNLWTDDIAGCRVFATSSLAHPMLAGESMWSDSARGNLGRPENALILEWTEGRLFGFDTGLRREFTGDRVWDVDTGLALSPRVSGFFRNRHPRSDEVEQVVEICWPGPEIAAVTAAEWRELGRLVIGNDVRLTEKNGSASPDDIVTGPAVRLRSMREEQHNSLALPNDIVTRWQVLCERHSALFTVTAAQVANWHEHELRSAREYGQASAVRFHYVHGGRVAMPFTLLR